MTDFRALCARMADELDHYRQLLMDDRRETHALATESIAALAQPEPAEPAWADIHYAWELLNAEGEWQAGGSANRLDDVRREGNRYLQTYAQDGPHRLIIQRHCVNTIKEVTND